MDAIDNVRLLSEQIDAKLKQWKSPGYSPTVPDVAASIEGWIRDYNNLRYYEELNSPSMSMAQRKMSKAWSYRAEREDAIDAMEEAVASLKEVINEVQTPEFKSPEEISNLKSLYGDDVSRYGYEPDILGDIYTLHRHVTGFSTMMSPSEADITNLRSVKSMSDEFAYQHVGNQRIHSMATQVSREIGGAIKAYGNNLRMRQHFERAAKTLDNMGIVADRDYAPTAYKTELTYNKDAVLDAIEIIDDLQYERDFYSPQDFIKRTVGAAYAVKAEIDDYYNPKAKRLVSDVIHMLEEARSYTTSFRGKSDMHMLWHNDTFVDKYERAMDKLSELDAFVRGI